MSRLTAQARDSAAAALYVPPATRTDCCARCRHSRAMTYTTSLHCTLHHRIVGKMGVCVRWAPETKWVAA